MTSFKELLVRPYKMYTKTPISSHMPTLIHASPPRFINRYVFTRIDKTGRSGTKGHVNPPDWPKECLPSSWSIQQRRPRPATSNRAPTMQPIHIGRKGSHVAEAADVRTITPTQTDPMLKAATFRRFISSIFPAEFIRRFLVG
jgi:hypothetical protein